MGASGLAVLLIACGALVSTYADRDVFGLAPQTFAALAATLALVLLFAGTIVEAFRARFADGVRMLILIGILGCGAAAAYGYRAELSQWASRLTEELTPETTVTPESGEVVVTRRLDGNFVVRARVNDRETRMIFDTGASSVVLTAESAREAGIDPKALSYNVPVATANGTTLAAQVVVERIAVGAITQRRVRALVVRPGLLRENLLGMTFLDKLASYEVRANRLTLRGAAGT